MAQKKKKPAPKKTAKKVPPKKKVAKRRAKPAPKPVAKKAKVAKKPPPKRAAPPKLPPRVLPAPPKAVFKKPPVMLKPPSAPVAPKAAKTDKEPVNRYRRLRKWTIPKIEAILADAPAMRARIHSKQTGSVTATELLTYLRMMETEVPNWKVRRDSPGKKKKGRPAKGKPATPVAAPAPVLNPATTLEAAKRGSILPPRPNGAMQPPAFAPRAAPVFRLPKLLRS